MPAANRPIATPAASSRRASRAGRLAGPSSRPSTGRAVRRRARGACPSSAANERRRSGRPPSRRASVALRATAGSVREAREQAGLSVASSSSLSISATRLLRRPSVIRARYTLLLQVPPAPTGPAARRLMTVPIGIGERRRRLGVCCNLPRRRARRSRAAPPAAGRSALNTWRGENIRFDRRARRPIDSDVVGVHEALPPSRIRRARTSLSQIDPQDGARASGRAACPGSNWSARSMARKQVACTRSSAASRARDSIKRVAPQSRQGRGSETQPAPRAGSLRSSVHQSVTAPLVNGGSAAYIDGYDQSQTRGCE